MLRWCAYCQEFQGEVPPFEDLRYTHGMCLECEIKGLDLTETEVQHTNKLRALQEQLFEAGKSEDLGAARRIVDGAVEAGVRPVDVLLGLLGPLLYRIGDEWESGTLSVSDEHRYTSFCETVFEVVKEETRAEIATDAPSEKMSILLLNAHGNSHTLGIRILALWLQTKNVKAIAIYPSPSVRDLTELVKETHPKFLMVSVALAEQRPGAVKIAESMAALRIKPRPKVIVGGYAVKSGMISPVPDAILLADIALVRSLLTE